MIRFQILRNRKNFANIKPIWQMLYAKKSYEIFSSFEFVKTILSNFEEIEIYIVIIFEYDRPELILPMCKKESQLEFINSKHSDYCELIGNNNILTKSIIQQILNQINLNGIVFENLKTPISYLSSFKTNSCSYLELDKTDSFPSNFKHMVYRQRRRLKRILNKYNYSHKIVSSPNNFPRQGITAISNSMIKEKRRKKNFIDKSLIKVIEELFKRKMLIISIIFKEKNVPVAISFILKKSNKYYFWIDLYLDIPMINLFNNTSFIKKITKKNNVIIDFCRGLYEYKKQNYRPIEIESYISFYFRNSIKNKAYSLFFKLKKFF